MPKTNGDKLREEFRMTISDENLSKLIYYHFEDGCRHCPLYVEYEDEEDSYCSKEEELTKLWSSSHRYDDNGRRIDEIDKFCLGHILEYLKEENK